MNDSYPFIVINDVLDQIEDRYKDEKSAISAAEVFCETNRATYTVCKRICKLEPRTRTEVIKTDYE